MSARGVVSAARVAEQTAVQVAWAQWSALTAAAVPPARGPASAIVDPEALILISLAVEDVELRLADVVAGWARTGAFLLSLQRMKSLVASYPAAVRDRLGFFAWHAVEAGDARWRRWAPASPEGLPAAREKPLGPLRLTEGPALVLRLRAAFGVSAKADLLALLLGLGRGPADLKVIALATGYTSRAVRTAAEEMVLAGVAQKIDGHPPSYFVEPGPWAAVLRAGQAPGPAAEPVIPPWRFWSVAFAFLADVLEWARAARQEGWSAYLASSRARDLYERHLPRLRLARIPAPGPGGVVGPAFLELFGDAVARIRTWALERV